LRCARRHQSAVAAADHRCSRCALTPNLSCAAADPGCTIALPPFDKLSHSVSQSPHLIRGDFHADIPMRARGLRLGVIFADRCGCLPAAHSPRRQQPWDSSDAATAPPFRAILQPSNPAAVWATRCGWCRSQSSPVTRDASRCSPRRRRARRRPRAVALPHSATGLRLPCPFAALPTESWPAAGAESPTIIGPSLQTGGVFTRYEDPHDPHRDLTSGGGRDG